MSVPTSALPSLSHYRYSSHSQELHSSGGASLYYSKKQQPLSASPLSSMRHTANLPSPKAASSASTSATSAAAVVTTAPTTPSFPHSRHQPWQQPHYGTADADEEHGRSYSSSSNSNNKSGSNARQEVEGEPFRSRQRPPPLSTGLPSMPPPRTLPPPHSASPLIYRPHQYSSSTSLPHPEAVELQHPAQAHFQQHPAQQSPSASLFHHHQQQQQRHSVPSIHSPLPNPSYTQPIHSPSMPQQPQPQQHQKQQYQFMPPTPRQADTNIKTPSSSQHPQPAGHHHRPYDLQSPAPTSRTFWNHYETSLLVQLWLEFEAQFMANKRNAGVWAQLAERLTERSGRHRTVRECRIKWKNMWAKHRDLANASHMSLEAKLREFPHFSDFVEIKQRSTLQSSANDNAASEGKLSPAEDEPHTASATTAAATAPTPALANPASVDSPFAPAFSDGPEFSRSAYTAPAVSAGLAAAAQTPKRSISPPDAAGAEGLVANVSASSGLYSRKSSSPSLSRPQSSRPRKKLPRLHIASHQQYRLYQSHPHSYAGYHTSPGMAGPESAGPMYSNRQPVSSLPIGHHRTQSSQVPFQHYADHPPPLSTVQTAIPEQHYHQHHHHHHQQQFRHHQQQQQHQYPTMTTTPTAPRQPVEHVRRSSLSSILAPGIDHEAVRPQSAVTPAKTLGSSSLHHLLSPAATHTSTDTTPYMPALSGQLATEHRVGSLQLSRRNSIASAAAIPTSGSRTLPLGAGANAAERSLYAQKDTAIADLPDVLQRIDTMDGFGSAQAQDAQVDLLVDRMRSLVSSSPVQEISSVAQQIMSYIESESRRRQQQSERHHKIVLALAGIISGSSSPVTESSGFASRCGSTKLQQQQQQPSKDMPQYMQQGAGSSTTSNGNSQAELPGVATRNSTSSSPKSVQRAARADRLSPESPLTISPVLSSPELSRPTQVDVEMASNADNDDALAQQN